MPSTKTLKTTMIWKTERYARNRCVRNKEKDWFQTTEPYCGSRSVNCTVFCTTKNNDIVINVNKGVENITLAFKLINLRGIQIYYTYSTVWSKIMALHTGKFNTNCSFNVVVNWKRSRIILNSKATNPLLFKSVIFSYAALLILDVPTWIPTLTPSSPTLLYFPTVNVATLCSHVEGMCASLCSACVYMKSVFLIDHLESFFISHYVITFYFLLSRTKYY